MLAEFEVDTLAVSIDRETPIERYPDVAENRKNPITLPCHCDK